MAWTKLPAIEGKHGGCLNCGPRPSFFPPDGVIAVGFGYAALERDGVPVWMEPNSEYDETNLSCWRGGLNTMALWRGEKKTTTKVTRRASARSLLTAVLCGKT